MSNHVFDTDLHQEMGLMTSYRWQHEPRGVLFMLARYKFVAKMLEGYGHVLEVGCGDGFGARLVRPVVESLTCTDIDPAMIASAIECQSKFDIEFKHTFEIEPADAIYSLDVIEHMPFEESRGWLKMLSLCAPVVIIGSPSLESQQYASPLSRENHVNCMTGVALKAAMRQSFRHVLLFSMNDEVVHTGFSPMSHYNFVIGIN